MIAYRQGRGWSEPRPSHLRTFHTGGITMHGVRTASRRLALVSALASTLPALGASAAPAHVVGFSVTCSQVTFSYTNFAAGAANTVTETVKLDGAQLIAKTFTFNGPS